MSTIVFLGPSLSRAEAEKLAPNAEFWPPAQAGDVYRACQGARAETIGLIDGVFGTAPSVWHKEILYALSRGVRVLGSSSMGALRAAECADFGMEGVGEIYEMYTTGVLDADDEVAVGHLDEPDGFVATTVPMVRVRKIIELALDSDLLRPEEAAPLVAALLGVFYADRTTDLVDTMIHRHVAADRASQLIDFARSEKTDPKAADARLLLARLDDPRPRDIDDQAPYKNFVFEPTVFWKRLRAEIDFPHVTPWFDDPSHPVEIGRRVDIGRGALLEPWNDLLGRDRRLFALLVQAECSRLGVHVCGDDVKAKAESFRRDRGLLDMTSMKAWLREQGLSTSEWYGALAFLVQIDKLAAEHALDLRRQIPLLVALQGGWHSFSHLEGNTGLSVDGLSDDDIHAALVERELPNANDLDQLASLLSFSSASELLAAIEHRSAVHHDTKEGTGQCEQISQ